MRTKVESRGGKGKGSSEYCEACGGKERVFKSGGGEELKER